MLQGTHIFFPDLTGSLYDLEKKPEVNFVRTIRTLELNLIVNHFPCPELLVYSLVPPGPV